MSEAVSVAFGERPPRHSAREYLAEAARWATRHAHPDETHTETLARLCVVRETGLNLLYRAATIARAWAGDSSELVNGEPARGQVWHDLLVLANGERRKREKLRDALERLLTNNTAAAAAYLLILREERT